MARITEFPKLLQRFGLELEDITDELDDDQVLEIVVTNAHTTGWLQLIVDNSTGQIEQTYWRIMTIEDENVRTETYDTLPEAVEMLAALMEPYPDSEDE